MSSDPKAVRRYHAGVERALGLFDASNEWADYIAFLSRLAKSLQASPPGADVPLKSTLAKYLALCLKPSLPAGVHQKALELYDLIFSLLGKDGLSRDLAIWLPGFSQTLTFASLTTRPLFLSLYDEHLLRLPSQTIRPALRAIILSLLPGIEEENSEDFERTLKTFNQLRHLFAQDGIEEFFWQSFFLASITSVNKRPGALVYLTRYLPKLGPQRSASRDDSAQSASDDPSIQAIKSVTTPEPGLLLRCFATGLQDEQPLVQRGFLDLLVTHLPLNSSILQTQVVSQDLDLLVTAALSVVLKRDMSLNRRLWSWFVGREDKREGSTDLPTAATGVISSPISPQMTTSTPSKQDYFSEYGLKSVVRSLEKMLSKQAPVPAERARPFRIMLSLMDRWVIGRQPVDALFIPAMRDLQKYQTKAPSQSSFDEVFRSANVFFDATEPHFVASQLYTLLRNGDLDLVEFIVSNFSLQEEDMTTTHLPILCLVMSQMISEKLSEAEKAMNGNKSAISTVQLAKLLDGLIAAMPLGNRSSPSEQTTSNMDEAWRSKISEYYDRSAKVQSSKTSDISPALIAQTLLGSLGEALFSSLSQAEAQPLVPVLTNALLNLIARVENHEALRKIRVGTKLRQNLEVKKPNLIIQYESTRTTAKILDALHAFDKKMSTITEHDILTIIPTLVSQFWEVLLPSTPQFHVEAVDQIWNLRYISRGLLLVDSKITEFMSGTSDFDDQMARFSTLWMHTRFPEVTVEFFSADKRESEAEIPWALLHYPVLGMLDAAESNQTEDPRRVWLGNLPSLRPIFKIVYTEAAQENSDLQMSQLSLFRIHKVLSIARQSDSQRQDFFGAEGFTDTILDMCTEILSSRSDRKGPAKTAMSILRLITDEADLRGKSALMDFMVQQLSEPSEENPLQESILETLQGVFAKPNSEPPPSDLLPVLIAGISSNQVDYTIDKWIALLCNILPLYSTQILFAHMLKLTACFCDRTKWYFEAIQTLYGRPTTINPSDDDLRDRSAKNPEKSINNLLAGLEYVLARAHTHLADQSTGADPGTVAAPDATQSRSIANNRLTVILCMQDTIKLCGEIWAWRIVRRPANMIGDSRSFNYISSRLRTRTRRILENLADAEPQECLETLMGLWTETAREGTEQDATLNLMQSLDGARPKFMMPATFNAIYNRTNPSALDQTQKSSLSVDVNATELMAFLIAYTRALEDDLLEEIWTDCTAFLREVLANPMPHRQILLKLLEFVAVMCEKMENTNFGEVSKMRRELSDLCARLFTAIFTIKPVGTETLPQRLSEESKRSTDSMTLRRQKNSLTVGNTIEILCESLPVITNMLGDSDRLNTAISGIAVHITGPALRSRQFPQTLSVDILRLLQMLSRSQPNNKVWRKDIMDAFNDGKFFQSPVALFEAGWLGLIRQVLIPEKGLFGDILSRLTLPTTAGIMFGVGASAARTEADRRTQLLLKRISVLLIAGETDAFVSEVGQIVRKVEELLTATAVSSPSSATRADIYTLLRAMALSFSEAQLVGIWPIVDAELRELFDVKEKEDDTISFTESSLLQGAKLLDLLLLLKPEEFQLHEWLFVTDTIDAIHPPHGFTSSALADALGTQTSAREVELPVVKSGTLKKPWLCNDGRKVDDTQSLLRPFFRQLSIHAFEDTYNLEEVDIEACRKDLLIDLFTE
ncbi:hypothetical protein PV10_06247 [Exophiala mesophila]|uniref:Uncharacterized protein n=1 Tax=Exophiala mesophila TaxID=212818 RepID=A0A0D1ZXZ0_EXOME|nr:uncharacterized protein PV10_06247 [Exophiala mesophila]KIV91738.1 hypothetical protein PV10_06247 [Exophiala mesophila]